MNHNSKRRLTVRCLWLEGYFKVKFLIRISDTWVPNVRSIALLKVWNQLCNVHSINNKLENVSQLY